MNEPVEIIDLEPVTGYGPLIPVRRILRWLVTPSRSPLVVAFAFILGNAAGVEAGTRSSVWVDALVVFVAMGGLNLLTWLLRRIAKPR